MVIIKRLDSFLLQRFLPLLAMTFFISLFIVMMQFLWRYIEDLVGKGLSIGVVAELFGYASLTMVPTALPLAVLLASLMTFGNLGEKFELTAMKSAGISLIRIMLPLIVFMSMLAVGAFFFQNNVLPIAQTKMWTLLFSMRQKSPEVEIPEKSFYDQIPGMNLYVDAKNRETGVLYDMIIYDTSRGMDNARIILADSGKISFTRDRKYLFLDLIGGEMFENFRDNSMGFNTSSYMPFRSESFDRKQAYIAFDANFNRIDEDGMRSQYIGMNISQLSHAIDSIQLKVDSIGAEYGQDLKVQNMVGLPYYATVYKDSKIQRIRRERVHPDKPVDVDSVFNAPTPVMAKSYISSALGKVTMRKQEFEFKSLILADQQKLMRRHDIEMQKKFTLSLACLIFFFIGAPLGAIIKKGGIGTPLVISVILFVIYYIFDNMGYKMARDGKMEVWEGIWLSSAVMLPMGIFFTYKAVGDSAVFDFDAYKRAWRRLFRLSEHRHIAMKEIVMEVPDPVVLVEEINAFNNSLENRRSLLAQRPWFRRIFSSLCTHAIDEQYDDLVNHLSYVLDKHINALLNTLPLNLNRRNLPGVISTLDNISNILMPKNTDPKSNTAEND